MLWKDLLAKGMAAGEEGPHDAIRNPTGAGPRILDDAEVVSESKYGWGFLEQAITLWRLANAARADQIETIMDRVALAAGDGELRIETQDLHAFSIRNSLSNAVNAGCVVVLA